MLQDLTTYIWEEICRSCTSPHYLPLTCSLKTWSALFLLLKWSVISQVFCTISLQMEEILKCYRHGIFIFYLFFWQMVTHHLRGKRWVDVFSHLNKPNTKHFYSLSKRLWISLISLWLLASTGSWNGFDQWFSLCSVCILIISLRAGVKKNPSKFFVSAFKLIWKLKYWARLLEKWYWGSFLSAFYFILFQIKRQPSSPTVEFKWIQSFAGKKYL